MTDLGDKRLDWVSAHQSGEIAETVPLPQVRRSSRWPARWPILLVVAWAALAAVNVALFGVGSDARQAQAPGIQAGPRAVARANTPSESVPSILPSVSEIPVAQTLVPVSAAAYGPSGPGSGDNSGHAHEAIDTNAATAWLTDWYRSAAFGNLQAGTGLLIDMGRPVRITSIRIILGSTPGAGLEIFTGNAPVRSQMVTQGTVSDAGTTIRLNLAHPGSARYLLIWFTRLPPDSAGTFQAGVYDVTLVGNG